MTLAGGREGEIAAAHSGERGRSLARTIDVHRTRGTPRHFRLRLRRLKDRLGRRLDLRVAEGAGSLADEWLQDNRHIVLGALAQLSSDVPAGFYATLPKVPGDGRPRVELIAEALREGGDGYIDPDRVPAFIQSFQNVSVLDMGEIWALPAFLRLCALEQLAAAVERPEPRSEERPPHERIAGAVTSLRAIDAAHWESIFEATSLVERCLRRLDPDRTYAAMDFETRDRFRKAIEEIARWSGQRELTIAKAAVRHAGEWELPSPHVGFLLVSEVRTRFEREVGSRVPLRRRVGRAALERGGWLYFACIFALASGVVLAAAATAASHAPPSAAIGVMAALALLPALSISVAAANFAATHLTAPRTLAKMDFRKAVPDAHRSCIAVPALLDSQEEVDALLRQLESNYRGNTQANISMALLADPPDADQQRLERDVVLLRRAIKGIDDLNERYARDGRAPFLLLWRDREWNEHEGRWMGWERKRGKLHQFNQLLLGRESPGIEVRAGDPAELEGVKYVLTLDADTFLPPDAAARLVGAMAHPLNRPRLDDHGRIARGFTVLQPRVHTLPPLSGPTRFARIFHSDEGLDLYSRAVSDVYQDLFEEGIYAGKGLLDIESFERSLDGRVPENALLSHDLFEGGHGRVALVSDVVVIEEYPAHPRSYLRRLHRWTRGDWQLLPWLLPRVPTLEGGRIPNALNPLTRWKIFDNLRRSLFAPSLLALAVGGWLLIPDAAVAWTGWILAASGIPVILGALEALRRYARGLQHHGSRVTARSGRYGALARWAAALVLLPWESWVALDAIARTLWRLGISRRRLLQWTAASQAARATSRLSGFAAIGWGVLAGPVLGLGVAIMLLAEAPTALGAAQPLLWIWLFSPLLVWLLAERPVSPIRELDPVALARLRAISRRTWAFFERFVGPEDHWLPPDHVQLDIEEGIAHRTSPTNIGFGVLSISMAHDLGHVPLASITAALSSTVDSLDRMKRHRGHFFNWYDTRTLVPLPPRYVSTVDSGNLAVCFLATAEALTESAVEAQPRSIDAIGMSDTLGVLRDVVRDAGDGGARAIRLKETEFATAESLLLRAADDAASFLEALDHIVETLLPGLEEAFALEFEHAGVDARAAEWFKVGEVNNWIASTRMQALAQREQLSALLPWHGLLRSAPTWFSTIDTTGPVGRAWRDLVGGFPDRASPSDAQESAVATADRIDVLRAAIRAEFADDDPTAKAVHTWLAQLSSRTDAAADRGSTLVAELETLSARLRRFADEQDYGLLYDPDRRLLHIGFDADSARLDSSHYDLFASEARLASYFAIAKGDVPFEHWVRLGRPFGRYRRSAVLLSWAGTLFEYLTPALFLRMPAHSLSAFACQAAVGVQMDEARRSGRPWGVSESGYSERDARARYRYRAFGASGLALRREPAPRSVVAPYAAALALLIRPTEAYENLQRLDAHHLLGPLGYFEAVDFGPTGTGSGRDPDVVRSVMAHHQGMTLAALTQAVGAVRLPDRLHADRRFAALEHLLHERTPGSVHTADSARTADRAAPRIDAPGESPLLAATPDSSWAVDPAASPTPTTVLGDGTFSSLLTADGGGSLRFEGRDIIRWRPDPTRPSGGVWIYLQDLVTSEIWSVARAPSHTTAAWSEVSFSGHLVEFRRRDGGIRSGLTVVVVPGTGVEIRRVTVMNEGDEPRRIGISSFAEIAMAEVSEDRRHPAFQRLFVEGEYDVRQSALFFRRRSEGLDDTPLHVAHAIVGRVGAAEPHSWEFDREEFLGRTGSLRSPAGLARPSGGARQKTTHAPLDPAMSMTIHVDLGPGEEEAVTFLTAAGRTRAAVERSLDAVRSPGSVEWAIERARERERVLQEKTIPAHPEVEHAQRLLSAITFPFHSLRRSSERALERFDESGQAVLWSLGISGDIPLVLVYAEEPSPGFALKEFLGAHAYWTSKGVRFDLLVVGSEDDGYGEPLRDWLETALRASGADQLYGQAGGVHYVADSRLTPGARGFVEVTASLQADAQKASLAEALTSVDDVVHELPDFVPVPSSPLTEWVDDGILSPDDLLFANGFGGFDPETGDYRIYLRPGQRTPAPWVNVIANPDFGCLVSESGSGFTWDGNAGEHRVTAWSNDPVLDPPSEVLYLRDEETGEVWTPTPGPRPADAPYEVTHRPGSTRFHHVSHGMDQRLTVLVPPSGRVKVWELRLENRLHRPRRITATAFVEWVLGSNRSKTAPHLSTEYDPENDALLCENLFRPNDARVVAFLASDRPTHSFTADRLEFLGREGGPARPAGLERIGLSRVTGRGLDPCGALQIHIDLPPMGETLVHFFLGAADDREAATAAVRVYRSSAWNIALPTRVESGWTEMLGTLQIRTPDRALDLMVNRWLPYQILSSRIWGRTGFYQSSGAFGFRDQIQDSLALLWTRPDLCREHLLRAAAHQFEEGDVLHWWHPDENRGVRTRCSDDLFWLPYAVADYVACTGDRAVLDERVPFLVAPPLGPDELERYESYHPGDDAASLYEHCIRALERPGILSPRELPLIGTGDWNDGFNRVGAEGKGESVWLAWFLAYVANAFEPICRERGETARADRLVGLAESVRRAAEEHAWDGAWYRRATYDDGKFLGSSRDAECRIDSLSQSWAVLSGVARPDRARQAMDSVSSQLWDSELRLMRLLTPPFHAASREPGYIKSYPPGARENGGQYSHAAAWVGLAHARLGDPARAYRVLCALNPVLRSNSVERARHYRVEPYAVAGDIHAETPHGGRGGWTWYTGAAGWSYRLAVEGILGLRQLPGGISVTPCLPEDWPGYEAVLNHAAGTRTTIEVTRAGGVAADVGRVTLDGEVVGAGLIPLLEDGREHRVQVEVGRSRAEPASAVEQNRTPQ